MNKNKNLTVNEAFNIAAKNHKESNFEIATNLYKQILRIDPNHEDTNNNLALLAEVSGQYQKAQSYLEKVVEINPRNTSALSNLGNLFQRLKEHQKAKSYYEEAIKIDPNHADAYNNLGNIYRNLKEIQEAKSCYEKAIEINSNHKHAYNNLGIICLELELFQKSKSCCEKAIKIDPNFADAYNILGRIFEKLNEHQKIRDYFEKAIKINPNHIEANNNLGNYFFNLGSYKSAINYYKKAIEIDSSSVGAINNLGVLKLKLGKLQEAKDIFEKAIKIRPNYYKSYINLGLVFLDLGLFQKAKTYFKKSIEINPNSAAAYSNLGATVNELGEHQASISFYIKAIKIDPNYEPAHTNLSNTYIRTLDNLDKAITSSYNALKIHHKNSKFPYQSVPLFRLKHDVQQAQYLISKDYKLEGIKEFQKIGNEILNREENKEDKNNYNKKILLTPNEIDTLLPFYKSDHTYEPKKISGSCINPNKNWQDVEDEYFKSSNQIMYIDDFLSDEAIKELREFCLVSKIWNIEYHNKYLGAYSDQGFISPIHLQIAIELKKQLPKLFGPHEIEKFWGFKYDTTLGKGINIHADAAIHNLNFWITPDEYNNDKNSGGLKVYDVPAPDDWTFKDYNAKHKNIYEFLKDNNANCTNIPYKFNRAVLFNSAYFHETDKIDFKDEYEGRRINNTYLFGKRFVKK